MVIKVRGLGGPGQACMPSRLPVFLPAEPPRSLSAATGLPTPAAPPRIYTHHTVQPLTDAMDPATGMSKASGTYCSMSSLVADVCVEMPRMKGEHTYCNVLAKGSEDVLPCRQPAGRQATSAYLHCDASFALCTPPSHHNETIQPNNQRRRLRGLEGAVCRGAQPGRAVQQARPPACHGA